MTGSYRANHSATLDCDVLVVGSGAGGSCVAWTLCQQGLDVLMLEEGPFVPKEEHPANLAEAFGRNWRAGGLTVGLGRTPVAYAEGRCVGGGTEINSAIYQQIPEELLDAWATDYQIQDFGKQALKPYYEKVTNELKVSRSKGPLGPPSDLMKQGSKALGWETSHLLRAQDGCTGSNQCASGCPTGAKQSMTVSLLPQALASGMRLIAECKVTRLRTKKERVTLVKAIATDHENRRHALTIKPKTIFLCAGAIHTPTLLRRSGICRNIGDTLRLHPMVKVAALFDGPVNAHSNRLPLHAVTEFMPERRLGGSLFSPGLLSSVLAESWQTNHHRMQQWDHMGLYYAQSRGLACGKIRPLPLLPHEEPLVSYTPTPMEWQQLSFGIVELAELLFAAKARTVYPGIAGHTGWRSMDEVRMIRRTGLPLKSTTVSTIHLMGSCPLGESETTTATDSYGRVRGFDNLIVADASQIPEAPNVNPQATAMALALRNAEHFLSQTDTARTTAAQNER